MTVHGATDQAKGHTKVAVRLVEAVLSEPQKVAEERIFIVDNVDDHAEQRPNDPSCPVEIALNQPLNAAEEMVVAVVNPKDQLRGQSNCNGLERLEAATSDTIEQRLEQMIAAATRVNDSLRLKQAMRRGRDEVPHL